MWGFWTVLAAMTALCVALLLLPLWRRPDPGASRRAENIAIYRERVAELHAERDAGRIGAEQARALEDELGRRLLSEAASADEPAATGYRRPWLLTLLLVVAVPVLALALYLPGGTWRLGGGDAPGLHYLAARLQERVEAGEGDVRGWRMLGQVRMRLGEYEAAAEAFARANGMDGPPGADDLVREAEALALARDGSLQGRPARLVEKALEIDPDHGQALWYAGLAAAASGDDAAARRHWTRLLDLPDLPDAFRSLVEQRLAAL